MTMIDTISDASCMSSESGGLSPWNFSPGKRLLDAGVAGAGLVAGAYSTAAVAATSPWGYYGNNGSGGGYYSASTWGDHECHPSQTYACNPYAAKDWGNGWGYYGRPRIY